MNGITNNQVVSRASHLAIPLSLIVSSLIHANDDLPAGSFMAKMANGKYRAYAEGDVTTAFNTANANFAIDPAGPLARHFRTGDALESVAGVALGTILTYDKVTGVGTLSANSAANLAAGQKVRITEASASLGSGKGRLLSSRVQLDDADYVASGYSEGYMAKTSLTTDAAIAKVGVEVVTAEGSEIRMKL
jgi:hypothetical protein